MTDDELVDVTIEVHRIAHRLIADAIHVAVDDDDQRLAATGIVLAELFRSYLATMHERRVSHERFVRIVHEVLREFPALTPTVTH